VRRQGLSWEFVSLRIFFFCFGKWARRREGQGLLLLGLSDVVVVVLVVVEVVEEEKKAKGRPNGVFLGVYRDLFLVGGGGGRRRDNSQLSVRCSHRINQSIIIPQTRKRPKQENTRRKHTKNERRERRVGGRRKTRLERSFSTSTGTYIYMFLHVTSKLALQQ
jgi:hypothetical protein